MPKTKNNANLKKNLGSKPLKTIRFSDPVPNMVRPKDRNSTLSPLNISGITPGSAEWNRYAKIYDMPTSSNTPERQTRFNPSEGYTGLLGHHGQQKKMNASAGPLNSLVARDLNLDVAVAKRWADNLSNPFHYPPTPLGSVVPTFISTLLFRGTFTLTNGSGLMAVLPGLAGAAATPIITAAQLTSGTAIVQTATAYTNQALAGSGASSARVLSVAVRAWPNLAGTAAPGQMGVGLLNYNTTLTPFTGNSVDTIMGWQSTLFSKAGEDSAGLASWRPVDSEDLEFNSLYLTSITATGMVTGTVPYIVFSGLPNVTTVTYEVIQHIECTAAFPSTSMILASMYDSIHADVEGAFQYVSDFVSAPSIAGSFALASGFINTYNTAVRMTNFAAALEATKVLKRTARREAKVSRPVAPDDEYVAPHPGSSSPSSSETSVLGSFQIPEPAEVDVPDIKDC